MIEIKQIKMIEERETQRVLDLLTEVGEMLMTSGAHTARIIRNLERIAKGLGYNCELVLTYTGIVISIYKENKHKAHTLARTVRDKGINFETISEISILSWDVLENEVSIDEIKSRLIQIRKRKVYTNFQLYFWAPFASVALCMLFGGNWIQSLIVYVSTFIGFYFRRNMILRHHNHLLAFFAASTISISIIHFSGLFFNVQIKEALIVSILYLIPGVVMINSFIDYLEGYFESGTARFIYFSMAIFMLAFGFFISNTLFSLPIINTISGFDLSSAQDWVKNAYQPNGVALHSTKLLFGGITSLGFALIFNTSKRALWIVFLLGAVGYYIKYLLSVDCGVNLILSIFAASTFVGISGMYFAHRVHTPPIIFMIPAVINMIPGLFSYEFMMGMIDWISNDLDQKPAVEDIVQTFSYGINTVFILFALAFGVAFPIIVFKSYTVKGKDLNVQIKKLFKKEV